MKHLDRDLPDYEKQMQETLSLLQQAEFPIVVTGEYCNVSVFNVSVLHHLIPSLNPSLSVSENDVNRMD